MKIDVRREFTKEEIIQWVKEKGLFSRIDRNDLFFMRWQAMSLKVQAD